MSIRPNTLPRSPMKTLHVILNALLVIALGLMIWHTAAGFFIDIPKLE